MTYFRTLSEDEARAALAAALEAVQFARITVANWNVRGRKPTIDEMIAVASSLKLLEQAVSDTARGPQTDGLALAELAGFFRSQIERLTESEAA
jgi:hypothetical protein